MLLFDPREPERQLRLSQRFFEFRTLTPLTSPVDKNHTANGHGGWTGWAMVEQGSFY